MLAITSNEVIGINLHQILATVNNGSNLRTYLFWKIMAIEKHLNDSDDRVWQSDIDRWRNLS